MALTVVGDSGLAQDIAQQAFERTWQHAGLGDPRRGSGRTWLGGRVAQRARQAARCLVVRASRSWLT
ncbi:MAG: sigma factor [Pseudonocardiaceae bacterium]